MTAIQHNDVPVHPDRRKKESVNNVVPTLTLGETRQVSILFADMVASTRLIRDLDTEDARDLLDQAIEDIKQAVHAFGGVIARIQGDGVMAMFGVMAATEDHAQRATFAALRIRDTAQQRCITSVTPISLRVGVHSGPIFLRWQDNDFGRVLDAVGSAAHVASRVEKLCPPNSAAISRATMELLTQPIAAHFVDVLANDETQGTLEVFELSQSVNQIPGAAFKEGGWIHPLIGRGAPLSELRRHIHKLANGGTAPEECNDGGGKHIGVVGDPGIGKSRILHECTQIADRMRVRHCTLRGSEILLSRPFGALFPMIQRLILNAAHGNPDEAMAHLERIGLNSAEAQALCLFIANNGSEQTDYSDLQPDERHRLILKGSVMLILAQSVNNIFLLFADDVQYLDGETLSLLSVLAKKNIPGFAMIMAGRTASSLYLKENCLNVITLGPLDTVQTRELILTILRNHPRAHDLIGDEMVEEIVVRADGLPLAIEEFSSFALRMCANEDKGIPLRLPPRLENIFRARIENLPSGARDLCAICCVMGTSISLAHLLQITSAQNGTFEEDFQALLIAKILTMEMSGRLRFSHQLFQEAGYYALPKDRRKSLHARIYSALSPNVGTSNISQQELARHAKESGLFACTLQHLWKACEEAVAHAAIESVFSIYTDAKSVCAAMQGDDKKLSQTWASRFALLAFDAAQQLAKQEECRGEIAAIVDGHIYINPVTTVISKTHLAMIDWIGGRGLQSRTMAQTAWDALPHDAQLPLVSYAGFTLSNAEFATGTPIQAYSRLVKLIERLSDGLETATFGSMISVPGIMVRSFASWYGTDLGHYDHAKLYAYQCRNLAEQIDHVYSRLLSRLAEGYLLMRQGLLLDASEILAEGRAYCAANKFYGLETMAASWLSLCLISRGKIFQAQKIIDHSINNVDVRSVQNSCNYYLHESKARLFFACGEEEDGLQVIRAATQRCIEQSDLVHAAYGRSTIGEFQLKMNGDKAAIMAHLRIVQEESAAMGLTPLAHHIGELIRQ